MSFDPIYLQRLIDGELDRDETRKMLEMAETQPALWREMAGAFVESQLWETGFRKLELGIEPETHKTSSLAPKRFLPPVNRIRWLVMAAGLMVALTAGLLIGRFFDSATSIAKPRITDSTNDGLLAAHKAAADEAPALVKNADPSRTLVNYRPDYQLELEDANGNPVFDTEVPLYDLATAKQAGYQIDRQPSLPPKFVENVGKRGYWLDQNVNYVSGRLDDGRMFVVPVRTINLVRGQ